MTNKQILKWTMIVAVVGVGLPRLNRAVVRTNEAADKQRATELYECKATADTFEKNQQCLIDAGLIRSQ